MKVLNRDDKTEHKDPVGLFLYLNEIGKLHGVGRLDMVEDRFVGIKSRGYVCSLFSSPLPSTLMSS